MNLEHMYESCSLCPRDCKVKPPCKNRLLQLRRRKTAGRTASPLGGALHQRHQRKRNRVFRLHPGVLLLPEL